MSPLRTNPRISGLILVLVGCESEGCPYLQRLGLVCALPLSHSARSASTGFTRVARWAGSQAASREIAVAASAQAA